MENKDRNHRSTDDDFPLDFPPLFPSMKEKDSFTSFFQYQPIQNTTVSQPRDTPNLRPSIPRNPRINNTPSLEEVNSAMGGLCSPLRNNIINKTTFINIMRIKATLEDTLQRFNNFGDYVTPPPLVISMAKDLSGCRILRAKINEGKIEDVDYIISEVKPHLHELMMHPHASFLIQEIFQEGSTMDSIVFLIIMDEQKLKNVCMDYDGSRVIQKMLKKIRYPLAISPILYTMVVYNMSRIAVELMKDVNGSYVIMKCMKLFSLIDQKIILDELATNCIEVATHKIGCSIIQRCLSHAKESAKIRLHTEIISNAIILAKHPYGNYVLQYLVPLDLPSINEMVIGNLRGTYVTLSMDKYASNVVENLLQHSRQNDVAIIVNEILKSKFFLNVLQDPFGNYVAQTALEYTKGRLHRELFEKIIAYRKNLQNHLYGKKVFEVANTKRNKFFQRSQNNFRASFV